MFTGLVQRVGELRQLERVGEGWSLMIAHEAWPQPLELGESMAVQGACLTVTSIGNGMFTADLLDETLQRTAMRGFTRGIKVNLERALAMGERLGGHIVSGHVDERGRLVKIVNRGRDFVWRITCSSELSRQTVMKGSVAVDGVSLTVSGLGDEWLEVNLIPHTLKNSTLCERREGNEVNLEGDVLGKYVARLLGRAGMASGVTEQLLTENGFA